jgi:hypothetical protein
MSQKRSIIDTLEDNTQRERKQYLAKIVQELAIQIRADHTDSLPTYTFEQRAIKLVVVPTGEWLDACMWLYVNKYTASVGSMKLPITGFAVGEKEVQPINRTIYTLKLLNDNTSTDITNVCEVSRSYLVGSLRRRLHDIQGALVDDVRFIERKLVYIRTSIIDAFLNTSYPGRTHTNYRRLAGCTFDDNQIVGVDLDFMDDWIQFYHQNKVNTNIAMTRQQRRERELDLVAFEDTLQKEMDDSILIAHTKDCSFFI